MTEAQDAAAAPAPPGGASAAVPARAAPAGPGWAFGRAAGTTRTRQAPGPAALGPAGPAGSGWAAAPTAEPMAGAAASLTGTGWPGPDSTDHSPDSTDSTDPGAGGTGRGPLRDSGAPGSGHPQGDAGAQATEPARSSPREGAAGQGTPWFGTAPWDAADGDPADEEPFARVDAKRLEAALLSLRHPIVTVPLLLEAPGVGEARAERVKLLSQIDDYLLPRLRQSGAPILVALVGSTGAGKSTLMNSLVGKQVSATGIRRPTTNSPVLACHPDDMRWFAENVFLPTLPRVRQQGLAMPGRDGLLVLAASEGMPKGVAVLDTPDIDSVVQAHHDFAHQFLDASDLWLFVTTARRYADAAVWEMLKDARDRGAALAIALSRVPPGSARQLSSHFDAMLEANGLRQVRRFVIPETVVTDARLPAEVAAPVKDWLTDTARREDRRVAVLTQTMSGVLDTFRDRVPALAGHISEQAELRARLLADVDAAYATSLADFDLAVQNGSLLSGEVLARWQDFAGTGDLLRTLQVRRGRAGRPRRQRTPARATALQDSLQASLESLIAATADRAAEQVVAAWRQQPPGAALLRDLDLAAGRASVPAAGQNESDFVAGALADLGVASTGPLSRGADTASLARATPDLGLAATRAVRAWQQQVVRLVGEENVTRRSIARVVTFDEEPLGLVLMIGVLSRSQPEARGSAAGPAGAASHELLTSLFGAGLLRDLGARVRQDLSGRVGDLLESEQRRFLAVVSAAGEPDESAAADLLQAGDALEDAR